MKIEIRRPGKDEIDTREIFSWPIWEKGVSRFDWYYESTEECYLIEGKVIVTTEEGKRYEFGKGDLVTFPKGISCSWEILKAVRKHYNFK